MKSPDAAKFQAEGFLAIDRLIDEQAAAEIASVYDKMLSREVDCGATDRNLGEVTRQIMHPSQHHPLFRANAAIDAAREVAKELLGVSDPAFVYDMLIYKPPGHTATTPWHQDLAYAHIPFTRAGTSTAGSGTFLQFWVALDDVDEDSGCMHFVPGQHLKPLLEHYVASGDPADQSRMLAITDPETALDLSKTVACPLRVGGATVHGFATPHFTSGNRTASRRRRAYIFNFANPHPQRGSESQPRVQH
ncbi:MAG: phytanoyl-CoA dioxygenase family protein [Candidatus Binataceae bacterium]